MAYLQQYRSGTFHIGFRFGGRLFKRSLRTKSEQEANARRERLEENIRLVESGRIELDPSADIPTFLLSDGKVHGKIVVPTRLSLQQLFQIFFDAIPDGNLEESTLSCMQTHRDNLLRHFGNGFAIQSLATTHLQEYVNQRSRQTGRRGRTVSAITIRKELATFKTVWTWGVATERMIGEFPHNELRLPKVTEPPPFQTWEQIEQQISNGGLNENEQADLWGCLYLRVSEIKKVLAHVKKRAQHSWIHPMVVTAAHTGARRSELLRAEISDVDRDSLVIRERKGKRGQRTQRRVPLSSSLKSCLHDWLDIHPGGRILFVHLPACSGRIQAQASAISKNEAHDHFQRTLKGSKWRKVPGWHCLRHSFISNLASQGIDQRMIDEFVGHTTESMRRRYRHLFPETKTRAIKQVFG